MATNKMVVCDLFGKAPDETSAVVPKHGQSEATIKGRYAEFMAIG